MQTPNSLPPVMFARGTELAKGTTYLGIPLTEFSREELIAIAAEGWMRYHQQLESGIQALRTLQEFRNA